MPSHMQIQIHVCLRPMLHMSSTLALGHMSASASCCPHSDAGVKLHKEGGVRIFLDQGQTS